MLDKSVNGQQWTKNALNKLKSFLDRAPVITSTITSSNGEGVFVIVNDKKQKKFFPYDFNVDPKVWVHDVKDWIVAYYPRLVETITAPHILTPDEKALIVEETGTLENLPDVEDRVVQINSWRIDKIIRFRGIFLLLKEGEITKNGKFIPTDKPIMRRFKYTGEPVLFLRHYREGTYKDLSEISKEFFDNAIPLDDVEIKNE